MVSQPTFLERLEWNRMKNGKTRKVGGTDLSMKCFLHIGDPENTSSWLLPVHDPTSAAKTQNLLKGHLAQFAQMKSIPAAERGRLWERLIGACIAHGIPVRADDVPAEPVKPTEPPKLVEPIDPKALAIFADADRKATAFLKSLGYE
jgi:hypothetical protein